ncbi:hypothetical protein H0H93_016024 [Arthromyces matolae]|nr:hypothetical protein H0H93_016024 [Arthromyces matolae]
MHYPAPSDANPWGSAHSFRDSSRPSRSIPRTPICRFDTSLESDVTPSVSDHYSDVPANEPHDYNTPPIVDDIPGLSSSMAGVALDDADEECLRGIPEPGTPQPGRSKRVRRKPGKFAFTAYVVFAGHKTGIFRTWDATSFQLDNYDGFARWKGYTTLEEAKEAWKFAVANGTVGQHPPTPKKPPPHAQPTPSSSSRPANSSSSSPSSRQANASSSTPSPLQPSSDEEPSLTELSRKKRIHSEECWYSVLRGDRPGVYLGASAAGNAAGSHPRPKIVKHPSGEAAANRFFVKHVMARGTS